MEFGEVWDAGDCAAFFKVSRKDFLRKFRSRPSFPDQLHWSFGGRPRWSSKVVKAWIPQTGKPRQFCLYRHYAESGGLLYAGISFTALRRMARHATDSHWFDRVAVITIQRFATKAEAMAAERKAIRTEDPQYNRWLKRRA